jgi:hypothetical protein
MVLACTQAEAQCVGGVLNANLPKVVTGTAACINAAVGCVAESDTAVALANCTRTLEGCALDQAVAALPPEVGTVVTDISDCVSALRDCTNKATTPGELTACGQAEVRCVGTSLGVTPPQPVSEAVRCAESAVDCTLDASTAAEVRTCASDLVACNATIANPDAPLSCNARWTQCLIRNPFNFLQCAVDFNTCQNTTN